MILVDCYLTFLFSLGDFSTTSSPSLPPSRRHFRLHLNREMISKKLVSSSEFQAHAPRQLDRAQDRVHRGPANRVDQPASLPKLLCLVVIKKLRRRTMTKMIMRISSHGCWAMDRNHSVVHTSFLFASHMIAENQIKALLFTVNLMLCLLRILNQDIFNTNQLPLLEKSRSW